MRCHFGTWTLALGLCCASVSAPAADAPPPPPDYARPDAWAAWPGRANGADALAPGLPPARLAEGDKADVFFIHPTTYLTGAAHNARYDEPGLTSTQIEQGVLRFQASVFNACCRIYAPHYRQAALSAFWSLGEDDAKAAYELAYADVLRAFDYYIAHENQGRPFIIASHSQGSLHALRLLQERISGQPLKERLVAAYVIGYYVPVDIESLGIAVCDSPTQTGCLVDWNTVKEGVTSAAREQSRFIWWEGRYQHPAARRLVCVNPLNWRSGGTAGAELNLGALPGVRPGEALVPTVPRLTGARCDGALLHIDIPFGKRRGFANPLTLFGSYHVYDYNVFYTNIRINAEDRVRAYRETPRAPVPGKHEARGSVESALAAAGGARPPAGSTSLRASLP
jgi:hypothetical protein